ncbi:TetR/AcrR family transcriptional regulator [Litchfieldia alkalitelluris]|uniref:TetR/AcrR family transcriptional regulator n=1 Tax=Litchfieldia alkalitelluris TaxID=304268 RepID=UPI0014746D04|nr:TetR family transcriptional regulator [Litchfieldia alkalitelluris]
MPKVSEEYKEKRRLEILEIAEKTFIDKGFSETTMTDIVNATGLSRGGLYHYFSNTDELYQAIIHEKDKTAGAFFHQLVNDFDTAWEGIEHYLIQAERALLNNQSSFASVNLEYFIVGRSELGRKEFISKRYAKGIQWLVELLSKGVRRGEFTPIQPLEAIAIYLLNIIDSIHIQLLVINVEDSKVPEQFEGVRIYLKHALGYKELGN